MTKKLFLLDTKRVIGLLLFMAFFFGQYESFCADADGLGAMEVIDADFDIDDSSEQDSFDDLLTHQSQQHHFGLSHDFGEEVLADETIAAHRFVGVPLFISLHRLLIDC